MNAKLGSKIKELRESKGLTQEQMADKLTCSRQRYSRLEKGLIDISYAQLLAIADILNINVRDITDVLATANNSPALFRNNTNKCEDKEFKNIMNMLDVFYAHKKLYISTTQENRHGQQD